MLGRFLNWVSRLLARSKTVKLKLCSIHNALFLQILTLIVLVSYCKEEWRNLKKCIKFQKLNPTTTENVGLHHHKIYFDEMFNFGVGKTFLNYRI